MSGKKTITPAAACQSLLLFLLPAILSCTLNSTKPPPTKPGKTPKQPVVITAGKPFIVDLDTCPPVQTITVPRKDSFDYAIQTPFWTRIFKLGPPQVRPADFFIEMPRFSNEEGLQAHSVYSSFQDSHGNLWFGTHGGGVTRFDGKSSVTFTELGCNDVRVIVEDSMGNIWFAMGGCGLVKYDGRAITSYTTVQGLPSNELRSLVIDKKGNLWIGTDGYGVSCFNGKSFKNFSTADGLAHNKVMSIAIDQQEKIWFATDAGASFYDGKSFKTLSMADGLIGNTGRSIICDKKNTIWIGTGNGVSRYDGHTITNLTVADGLAGNNIQALMEDHAGNIWIGAFGSGVSKYNGNRFENFSQKNGLANNFVKTITEDWNHNIWIGAEGGGVTCYEGSAIIHYSGEQGLFNHYITAIAEDKKGNLWFGPNSGGVCRYDGKTFTNYSWQQGFAQNRVNDLFEDSKGNMWMCTSNGISKFDGTSFSNYNTLHGIRNNDVQGIMEDKESNLWINVENGGLTRFNGKSMTTFTKAQGLPSNNIRYTIIDSAGVFWIATFGGGVCRYDGKTFTTLDTAQGLTENFILSMEKDSHGNLWLGTSNGGVNILRKEVMDQIGKSDTVLPSYFEHFTTYEGLPNNVVYDIVEDKNHNIVIGTNFGLTVIKGGLKVGRPIISSDLEFYNQQTGYAIQDLNGQGMFVDSKGITWGGTGHDLVRFDYDAIRKKTPPLKVAIQGININNESPGWYFLQSKRLAIEDTSSRYVSNAVEVEELLNHGRPLHGKVRDSLYRKYKKLKFDSISRFYPLPRNLVLPYKFNNVRFVYAAMQAAKSKQVRYQYMLEGYDDDWNPVTEQASASFGNIDEGSYAFKVKVLNPEGTWSEPTTFQFRVLPPWYRTLWAYAAYLIALVVVLYTFYRNRMKVFEQREATRLQTVIATQEEERKRMSRDLHDDIGTKLSALKLFLSSLRSNADKKRYEQVEVLADNSEKLINETITDVREMLLNLSPGILEEFGFTTAIQALINKINLTGAIYFELAVFGMHTRLRNEYELALYRITQELINNVLKHADAKNVSLQIGYREGNIILMIEDDGKGFDISKHKDGYGLKNLETRTKLLNGVLRIDSHVGQGTSVSIEIPYKW